MVATQVVRSMAFQAGILADTSAIGGGVGRVGQQGASSRPRPPSRPPLIFAIAVK